MADDESADEPSPGAADGPGAAGEAGTAEDGGEGVTPASDRGGSSSGSSFGREHRTALLVGGGLLLLVVVIVLATRGGDDSSDEPRAEAPPSTAAGRAELAGVPNVECGDLLTTAEIEAALGVADLDFTERAYLELVQGETCTYEWTSDERHFVTLTPGSPSDFEDAALLVGVTGAPVRGVGDAARWFGGDESEGEGESGALAVAEVTDGGVLVFRVGIGRPDLDPDEQLEVATEVARAALARFPGVDVPLAAASVIEAEPPDRSGASLVDALLAAEADGRWTLGEGLVATLAAVLGEEDARDVLPAGGVADPSATEAVSLALQHLADGAASEDPGTVAELERLLDRLVVTEEEREQQLADAGPLDLGVTAPTVPLQGARASANEHGIVLAATEPAGAEAQDECPSGSDSSVCTVEVVLPGLDAFETEYRLFAPYRDEDLNGWTDDDLAHIVEGVIESAVRYEQLGTMPELVHVDVWPFGDAAPAMALPDEDVCLVDLFLPLRQHSGDWEPFKQWISRELAYCLVAGTFRETLADAGPGFTDPFPWWLHAVAVWLSTEVHDDADLEHENLQERLGATELPFTVSERGGENWVYFEALDDDSGDDEMMALVGNLVGTEPGSADDALASVSDAPERYHEFVEDLTDESLADDGGGTVPYEPPADTIEISGRGFVDETVLAHGVTRYHVMVESGLTACVTYQTDDDVLVSWREGAPGSGGGWTKDPPDALEGESVFVVTTTSGTGSWLLEVEDVGDDPGCEEEDDEGSDPVDFDCPLVDCETSEYFYELLDRFLDLLDDATGADDADTDVDDVEDADDGGVTVEEAGG